MVQLSHPYMTTGKTIALTRQTFVGKVMSLLFNMLSRLVITFLPRSKRLLISCLQSPSAVILEPRKIKSATADGDFSHEIKRRLLLRRKVMTNLDSILKNRDITLPTKVRLVKLIFPVVMYGYESWTITKAEHRIIDAFELWCWRRPLRVSWTARRSNQSILKEISPEYSFEGLMLKLKLQYFGHQMQRADSFEKTLMLGKTEGRRRGDDRMRSLDGITNLMDMLSSMLQELVMTEWPSVLQFMGSQRVGHD